MQGWAPKRGTGGAIYVTASSTNPSNDAESLLNCCGGATYFQVYHRPENVGQFRKVNVIDPFEAGLPLTRDTRRQITAAEQLILDQREDFRANPSQYFAPARMRDESPPPMGPLAESPTPTVPEDEADDKAFY